MRAIERLISDDLPDDVVLGLYLNDAARGASTVIVGPPGSGKTRLLSRGIVWQDFWFGVPTVVLDPIGECRNNLFDKIARFPKSIQRRLWERVLYVDVAGVHGYVKRDPLLYRSEGESLFDVSQRFINVIRKIDPSLQSASVLGYNALAHVATHTGMALAALNCQYDSAEDLLTNTGEWKNRLLAAGNDPEVRPAVEYLLGSYDKLPQREKAQQTMTFLRKTAMLRLDPMMRTQFCSSPRTIDWEGVEEGHKLVILDFSGFTDYEKKTFALVWSFDQILSYIRRRGPGKSRIPFSLVIDELTYLLPADTRQTDLVATDLLELVARLARNNGCWFTCSVQSFDAVSQQAQRVLNLCGTHILGSTHDLDRAIAVAKRYRKWNPEWERKHDRVWGSDRLTGPMVLDERTTEYSIAEQWYLHAWKQMELPRFHFYVATPEIEGSPARKLEHVSIEGLDTAIYPDPLIVSQAASQLAARDGVRVTQPIEETIFFDSPPPRRSRT